MALNSNRCPSQIQTTRQNEAMTFFVLKTGNRLGPFTAEQIANMVRKGELVMSDLAWCEGNSQWFPIHQNHDLVAAVIPPLPDSHGKLKPAQTSIITESNLADSKIPPATTPVPVETSQSDKIEWEGTKKILQGVGLILLAAILAAFMLLTNSNHENLPARPENFPQNVFPLHKNLFSGHVLEANIGSVIEEQLPVLSRSFRTNHSLGWIIVICLVVLGIVKIVEGLKIIDSANHKTPDKK